MIDAGHGATLQMMRQNIDPVAVNNIFLTHLHYDHIADLGFFMISTWMCSRQVAPTVYGPGGTAEAFGHLLEGGVYDADIRARAQYPLRKKNRHVLKPEVRLIEPGVIFEDERVRVTAATVDHIPPEICDCFALRFEADGKSFVYSSDTRPVAAVEELARGADLLVHDCTFPRTALEFRDKVGVGTSAHTSPFDLGALAQRAGVKALVPYHFGHFDATNPVLRKHLAGHMPIEHVGPDLLEEVIEDIRKSYDGPVHLARDGLRFDL
ncbi:MAG: MBL fold metallo-hydrolase [Pararhodobacter sp.]|nr:MBL fold metallo-hydrolase [Pararhodobacter sp.]